MRVMAPQCQNGSTIVDITLRAPRREDGQHIHALIQACPPLDVNSAYVYLLLCEHFSQTCVIAHDDAGLCVGFVSAYVPPGRSDVLFVWQVAVHERARGQALAQRMIAALLERPVLQGVNWMETTVGPDNAASRRTFARMAERCGAHIQESELFPPHMFGAQSHDDERLLRIGPLLRH